MDSVGIFISYQFNEGGVVSNVLFSLLMSFQNFSDPRFLLIILKWWF